MGLMVQMDLEHADITEQIIGCAYTVHNILGQGFLEEVYGNALKQELEGLGFAVSAEHPLPVVYKGEVVGEYVADLVVNEAVICEIKAVESLHARHEVQLVNYLSASGIATGLLLNFGRSVQVKRKFRKPVMRSVEKSC